MLAQVPENADDGLHNRQDTTEGAIAEDDESTFTERNGGSVYLDANEDGPSVAEILKELRELPDTYSSTTNEANEASEANDRSPPIPSASFSSSSVDDTRSRSIPSLLQPSISEPLPPAITPLALPRSASVSRKGRRRSGVRHSFSSAIRVSARPEVVSESRDGAEAVVELHEESAAAFQDFLFWCYPQ